MKKILKKYKTAIIGCGNIGFERNQKNKQLDTYFKSVKVYERLELIAVSDVNRSVLKKISKQYKIQTYYDYKLMLKEHYLDLIIISTSNNTHKEILLYIAKFKPKIVFCEKPISDDYNSTLKIIESYRKKSIPLQVNFTRRFNDSYLRIYKYIKTNKIGKIKLVIIKYNRGFINNGSHFLDLILWLFGKPNKIKVLKKTVSQTYKNDFNIDVKFEFFNDINIYLYCLDINKLISEEIEFIGTKGKINVTNDFKVNYFIIKKDKKFDNLNNYFLFMKDNIKFNNNISKALSNIVDFLDGKIKFLDSSGQNYKYIFELMKNVLIKKKND